MGDKYDGLLAGGGRPNVAPILLPDAMESLNLNESLLAKDEDGSKILLKAVQNPWTGGIMLNTESVEDDDPSFFEAIKRSQMTSMLADDSRCHKYAGAISKLFGENKVKSTLDIGTGTGLLAILAAKAGVRRVEAFEMFEPLADIASKIVHSNNLDNVVSIHAKRSTAVSSMNQRSATNEQDPTFERCDALVTEIFDSALLGEGCIPVIEHAHEALLKENAVVIPAKATLCGTLVHSEKFERFHNLGKSFPFHRSNDGNNCKGSAKGIPLHWDAFTEGIDYTYISDTFAVFEFNFSKTGIKGCRDRRQIRQVDRTAKGKANCIITWWKLYLDEEEQFVYSTRPGDENWQDHWVPVLYSLPSSESLRDDDEKIIISTGHDDMTIWFALGDINECPPCACGYHILPGGPYRIFELSDKNRLQRKSDAILAALERIPSNRIQTEDTISCIDLSDESLCSLIASTLEPKIDDKTRKVCIFSVEETNEVCSFFYSQVARRVCKEKNKVNIEFEPLSELLERESNFEMGASIRKPFNVVLSEPYTRSMFSYPLATLSNLIIQIEALNSYGLLQDDFQVVPSIARVYARIVRFSSNTMQSCFKTIYSVQGVDHSCFRNLFQAELDSDSWQDNKQRLSLPMFQYNHKAMSDGVEVFKCDMSKIRNKPLQNQNYHPITLTECTEVPDAIVLWVEYDNEQPCETSRSEVMWLSKLERESISRKHGALISCSISNETKSLDVSIKELPEK